MVWKYLFLTWWTQWFQDDETNNALAVLHRHSPHQPRCAHQPHTAHIRSKRPSTGDVRRTLQALLIRLHDVGSEASDTAGQMVCFRWHKNWGFPQCSVLKTKSNNIEKLNTSNLLYHYTELSNIWRMHPNASHVVTVCQLTTTAAVPSAQARQGPGRWAFNQCQFQTHCEKAPSSVLVPSSDALCF